MTTCQTAAIWTSDSSAAFGESGALPLPIGPLPEGCAALLNQRIAIHSLTVEAAVHGDRRAALQALLLDPVVNSYEAAVAILEELSATR